MKSSLAASLFVLALVATSRGADASKEVHDAVRDFLDLKYYVWRETKVYAQGSRVSTQPIASGRTEVDGFTVGMFNWMQKTELAFVNFAPRTAFKREEGWKLIDDMDADELKAIVPRVEPNPFRTGPSRPHWKFVAPHDVLVAIVGMAPAPSWMGDKIVGFMALDEAPMLYSLLLTQGQIEWEAMPTLVRNKLGGISSVPPRGPNPAQREAMQRQVVQRIYAASRADYELYFRDGLISRLVINLQVAFVPQDGAPPREKAYEDTWAFDFSEVGRVAVTPDPVAKALFTEN